MIPILLTLLFLCLSILTKQAAFFCLASAVVTGWTTFRSGLWVLRNDPVKRRGRICFLFHVSVAIWLGAPSAGLSLFLMATMGLKIDDLEPTGIALLSAIALSSLIGLFSLISAWFLKIKVWVHPFFEKKLLQQLRGQLPPATYNYALFVTVTSVSLPILVVGAGLFAAGLLINPVAPALAIFGLLAAALCAGFACVMVSRRIHAPGPREYLCTIPAEMAESGNVLYAESETVMINDSSDGIAHRLD